MAMMDVWKMRVRMGGGQVSMRMGMRLIPGIGEIVFVLVMFVVAMPMRVVELLVSMCVRVPLAHMQPDA